MQQPNTHASPDSAGRWPKTTVLLVWLLACGLTTWYANGWPTDNRLANWVEQLDEDAGYRALAEQFGGDEAVLVRVDDFSGSPEQEAWLLELGPELAAHPAVRAAADPLHLPGAGDPFDLAALTARPVVQRLDLAAADPPRLDFLLAVHADATPSERASLAQTLAAAKDSASALGMRLRAAGHPLVAAALDAEAAQVERVFAPLLAVLAALATAVLLRSPRLAWIALLPAILASSGARAALRAIGIPSDLVLVTCGPLAFVLVLAQSLHLVTAFQRHLARTADPIAAARAAVREKLAAGALAAVTTSVGFGVFVTSGLRSVALLGTTVAATLLVSAVLLFAGLPILLAGFGSAKSPRAPKERARPAHPRAWSRFACTAFRRRRAVAGATAALLAAGIFGALNLRSETNALHYFPAGHPVQLDFFSLESDGAALSSVDVLARLGAANRAESPQAGPAAAHSAGSAPWDSARLMQIDPAPALRNLPGVSGVFGPGAVIAEASALGLPAFLQTAALRESERLDASGTWARWTLRFPTLDAGPTQDVIDAVHAALEPWAKSNRLDVHVAGSVPLMLTMQSRLIGTLTASLLLTALATGILFLVVARDARSLFAAFVTNLTPTAATLGAAALLGFPLDGATVMVAAVVLGLAVDNTFHLMHAAGPHGGLRARLRSFDRVGPAAATSSAALALGFSSLAAAGFAPTARFGILCAVGAAAALAADLIVLPAFWCVSRSTRSQ